MTKAIVSDAAALKLHVAGGLVWQTAGKELVRCTQLPPDVFVKTAARWEKFDCVRLMGSHENAALIAGLFGRIRVELVTPQVCPSKQLRKDPTAALFYMRGCMLAPSQGGYHVMTAPESLVYRACALAMQSKRIDDAVALLQQHPVWRPLHFLRWLNESFLCSLMVAVLDPRWFVDTRFPDRTAKLHGFFGLNPKTQAGAFGLGPVQRQDANCKLAMNAWYERNLAANVLRRWLQLGGLQALDTATEPGLAPGDFLWRQWADTYYRFRDDASKAATRGTVRASQTLISFLRLVWLSSIYRDSPSLPDGRASLFRPRDFFHSPVEARAFELHMHQRGG